MPDDEMLTVQGRLPAELGQAVSDAIHAAVVKGMDFDTACCVTVAVAADYARAEYGDRYLKDLARVVRAQRHKPVPQSD